MGLVAVLTSLFAWWIGTGAILFAVRRADRAGTAPWSVCFAGLPLLVFGLAGVAAAARDGSVSGLYGGFFAALALWGWVELSFLSGAITGPRSAALPEGTRGWRRAWAAWEAIAWHEMVLLLGLAFCVLASVEAPNAMAAWTYGTLYAARVLAKLNLFLGVPGINLEAVPRALSHIPSYFRQGEPSALFPITIILLSLATALWLSRLADAGSAEGVATFGLLFGLTALALAEHWMMLLPLADTKLWRWLMPDRAGPRPTPQEQG